MKKYILIFMLSCMVFFLLVSLDNAVCAQDSTTISVNIAETMDPGENRFAVDEVVTIPGAGKILLNIRYRVTQYFDLKTEWNYGEHRSRGRLWIYWRGADGDSVTYSEVLPMAYVVDVTDPFRWRSTYHSFNVEGPGSISFQVEPELVTVDDKGKEVYDGTKKKAISSEVAFDVIFTSTAAPDSTAGENFTGTPGLSNQQSQPGTPSRPERGVSSAGNQAAAAVGATLLLGLASSVMNWAQGQRDQGKEVEEYIPVRSVTINGQQYYRTSVNGGSYIQLTAEVIPANATNKAVVWRSSSGNKLAYVDNNGLVYVSGHLGETETAIITVVTVDGARRASAYLNIERGLAQGTPLSTVSGIGSYEGYAHLFSDEKVKRNEQPNVRLGASFNHGDKIINGDQITMIELGNGDKIILGPNAVIDIRVMINHHGIARPDVVLSNGRCYHRTASGQERVLDDSDWTVRTPTLATGRRGTEYVVAVEDKVESIYLLSGAIEVRSELTGEKLALSPGQGVSVFGQSSFNTWSFDPQSLNKAWMSLEKFVLADQVNNQDCENFLNRNDVSSDDAISKKESAVWFIGVSGDQYGPYSWEQLQKFASDGTINSASMVWRKGMPDWVEANKIKGLF